MIDEAKVIVGEFFITAGPTEDSVWIGRESGPAAGEGGQFPMADLEAVLASFYRERF